MIGLDDLRLMAALRHAGSLSGAARALSVTPPALSMRLKRLEQALGVTLVVRSSRHARFTAEGERLVAEADAVLARVAALPEALAQAGDRLQGPLRIVAPFGFGRLRLAPLVADFAAAHPDLQVTLDLAEAPWAASREADIVVHIGTVRDSAWVAHLLARNARWVCASPDYLAAHGAPAMPAALADHRCLCVRENAEDVTLWRFRRGAGDAAGRRARLDSIRIRPALTSNDGEVVRNWALAGQGVVLRSQWDVAPFVRAGRLKRLLAGWQFESADILALVPSRHGISARVARFVAFAKQRLGTGRAARRDPS